MASFAFTEEWMSLRASRVLPHLCEDHTIHYISSGDTKPKASFAGVRMFEFPRYQLQNSLPISLEVRRLHESRKIDFAVDYSYMCFCAPRIPFLEIIGGLYHSDFSSQWMNRGWLRKPFLITGYLHYCLPERIAIKRAKEIVTDSPTNAKRIRCILGRQEKEVHVVPNGVDSEMFELIQNNKFDRPKMLFVGKLHPRKGILPVLRGFVQAKDIDAEFTICGDGPLEKDVEDLSKYDKRIKYLGRVSREDLVGILARTNIFVFPSFAEGCPNALLEAMASGHLCLTYDTAMVLDVIGNAGLVAKKGSVGEILRYVAEVTRDMQLIRNMAGKAQERAKQYSWEKCAFELNKIIVSFSRRWKE